MNLYRLASTMPSDSIYDALNKDTLDGSHNSIFSKFAVMDVALQLSATWDNITGSLVENQFGNSLLIGHDDTTVLKIVVCGFDRRNRTFGWLRLRLRRPICDLGQRFHFDIHRSIPRVCLQCENRTRQDGFA